MCACVDRLFSKKGNATFKACGANIHTNVAKLLTTNESKANAQTHAGIAPYDWAKYKGHSLKMEQLLVTTGTGHQR